MDERLEGYSWGWIFDDINCTGEYGRGTPDLYGALPKGVYDLKTPVLREDLTIMAITDDSDLGDSYWEVYGQLKDGRWIFIHAGCTESGFDATGHACATIANSREECERFALTKGARERFGIVLED